MCRCKAAWHAGMTCEENKSHLEDVDTLKLASAQSWRKCPHCGSFPPCLLSSISPSLLHKGRNARQQMVQTCQYRPPSYVLHHDKSLNIVSIGKAILLCLKRNLHDCRHMVERVAGRNTMACRCGVGLGAFKMCTIPKVCIANAAEHSSKRSRLQLECLSAGQVLLSLWRKEGWIVRPYACLRVRGRAQQTVLCCLEHPVSKGSKHCTCLCSL